jgi:heme-degrading monooxygenase HmoA
MIVVIFEVAINPDKGERYFELTGELRKELETIDGFLSIERFQSLNDEDKYVSLSFWRDRDAVEAWYQKSDHREAQREGRDGAFLDYRIRVADVLRDYDMAQGRPA